MWSRWQNWRPQILSHWRTQFWSHLHLWRPQIWSHWRKIRPLISTNFWTSKAFFRVFQKSDEFFDTFPVLRGSKSFTYQKFLTEIFRLKIIFSAQKYFFDPQNFFDLIILFDPTTFFGPKKFFTQKFSYPKTFFRPRKFLDDLLMMFWWHFNDILMTFLWHFGDILMKFWTFWLI